MFQARGAPHLHMMLWLQDEDGNPAVSSLWDGENDENSFKERSQKVASFANSLIHGSLRKAACKDHDEVVQECNHCLDVHRTVSRFQCHSHKKSCYKKNRILRIPGNQGHGRMDGKIDDEGMTVPACRYNFPKNPSDETCFIAAFPKDHPKEELKKAKEDYKKVRNFLLRLTSPSDFQSSEQWEKFKSLSFAEFLYTVGMYDDNVDFVETDKHSFLKAKQRYLEALRCEVKSTGYILLERSNEDIFINNFNKNLATIHVANHDLQFITDPYAVVQYVTGTFHIFCIII